MGQGAGARECFIAHIVDQGVKAARGPEAKAFLDATFDVAGADAPCPSAEDAGEEGEGSFGVPATVADATELGGVGKDDCISDSALGWQVERVWGCRDCVKATLPELVVRNATGEVATVIAVDGVTINSDEFVVGVAEFLCGQVCNGVRVSG